MRNTTKKVRSNGRIALAGLLLLVAVLLLPAAGSAVTLGQVDDFEDGTTQFWGVGPGGGLHPFPPVNAPTGGPAGVDDNYLLVTATGGAGAGGKMVVINSGQWTGDYLTAGVGALTMNVRNLGSSDLYLRAYLEDPDVGLAPTHVAISADYFFLPAGSDWTPAVFLLDPAHLTALAGTVNGALGNVAELRILHNPIATFPPPPVLAQLGMDNILAASSLLLPVSNAGTGQTVRPATLVQLDGSGSSDPGGLTPLTYAWSIAVRPQGSTAVVSNPLIVNPTFTPDLPGEYRLMLVVRNSSGVASAPSFVTVAATNARPIANAGPNQTIAQIGDVVTLDGTLSLDPDGDPITYLWTFVAMPQGSSALLQNATTVHPSFVADRHGLYRVELVISDPWASSGAAHATLQFDNIIPVANAGAGRTVVPGVNVSLDGSGSTDAESDPLTYRWSFTAVPPGSAAAIAAPAAAQTVFVPDLAGEYVAQLIVNDSMADSVPATVQIQVIPVAIAARNDFDGDARSDTAVYYAPGGDWYGFNSTGGFWQTQFGFAGTIPVTGHFDADGKSDIGVYDPPTGAWYLFRSTDGFLQTQFGFAGTLPVVGDFDGDGISDIGVYHSPTGAWYLFGSTAGFRQTQFGFDGTIPVVGDFDGDGTSDIGVYDAPAGTWYVARSTAGFLQTQFGYDGTEPVVGDFDGDRHDDIGVYDPAGGTWYLFKSAEGFSQTQFGFDGTTPIGGVIR